MHQPIGDDRDDSNERLEWSMLNSKHVLSEPSSGTAWIISDCVVDIPL